MTKNTEHDSIFIKEFKASENKERFLLDRLDENCYEELCNMESSYRKEIAKKMIENKRQASNDEEIFDQLITKLANVCFQVKGSEFIRKGGSDFFGDLLIELAQPTDRNNFIKPYVKLYGSVSERTPPLFKWLLNKKKALLKQYSEDEIRISQGKLPEGYTFSPELIQVFLLIHKVAATYCTKENLACRDKLYSNLANKIFIPFAMNSVLSSLDSLKVIQSVINNKEALDDYFKKRLSNSLDKVNELDEPAGELIKESELRRTSALTLSAKVKTSRLTLLQFLLNTPAKASNTGAPMENHPSNKHVKVDSKVNSPDRPLLVLLRNFLLPPPAKARNEGGAAAENTSAKVKI